MKCCLPTLSRANRDSFAKRPHSLLSHPHVHLPKESLNTLLDRAGLRERVQHLPSGKQVTLKLSRDTARDVRRIFREGDFQKAIARVGRLRYTHKPLDVLHQDGSSGSHMASPVRLPAHTLVHGLLQKNKTVQAARQIRRMIEEGLKVNSVTFDAVLRSLLLKAQRPPSVLSRIPRGPDTGLSTTREDHHELPTESRTSTDPDESILTLEPSAVKEIYCRSSLILLSLARLQGVKREMWMYELLIKGLLRHGYNVEAALVLEVLMKDWQVRKTLHAVFSSFSPQPSEDGSMWIQDASPRSNPVTKDQVMRSELYHLYMKLSVSDLQPTAQLLDAILKPLVFAFRTNPTRPPKPFIHSILQPFMILLNLLQQRLIPFPEVGPLIRAVLDIPVHWRLREHHVWIMQIVQRRDGVTHQPIKVNAQIHADGIIDGLIFNLPSAPPKFPPSIHPVEVPEPDDTTEQQTSHSSLIFKLHKLHGPLSVPDTPGSTQQLLPPARLELPYLPPMLPPLDLPAYLDLLRYALYLRRNTALARTVFLHMTTIREPPLVPSEEVQDAMRQAVSGKVNASRRLPGGVDDKKAWAENTREIAKVLREVVSGEEGRRMRRAKTPTATDSV